MYVERQIELVVGARNDDILVFFVLEHIGGTYCPAYVAVAKCLRILFESSLSISTGDFSAHVPVPESALHTAEGCEPQAFDGIYFHAGAADRVVDAVGAYFLYGGPVIVIDYGTATTYDLVSEDGAFVAGVTAPGIRISAKALWSNAAKLPEIEIVKPESILAKTTITSMQAGLVYGTIGQAEYIIEQFKKQSGYSGIKVVATGGLGRIISEGTDKIDIYNSELTLQGMRLIFERTKGSEE